MSPTKRPDAIKRTPSSDSVSNYYRTLAALGSSEGSNAVGGSRAAFSILPSPPLVSPFTQLPDRKIRNAERRRQVSQHYNMPPTPLRGPVAPPTEPSYFPPVTVLEESSPLWIKAPARSSYSDGVGTLQTFNDKRASRTSDSSSLATPGSKKHVSRASKSSSAVTPESVRDETDVRLKARNKPRQWKHIISRPWFEDQIGRASTSSKESEDDKSKAPTYQTPTPQDSPEVGNVNKEFEDPVPASPAVTSLINVRKKSDDASAITLKTNSSAETPMSKTIEGLYRRTKQVLGFKAGRFAGSRDEQDTSDTVTTEGTGATLNSVTSQLRASRTKGRETTPAESAISDSASGTSNAASNVVTRWHQFQSLTRGRHRKVTTPNQDNMYTGSDKKQYLVVQMTDYNAPDFLPSEAQRVNISGDRQSRAYWESKAKNARPTSSSVASTSPHPRSLRAEGSVKSVTPSVKRDESPRPSSLRAEGRVKSTTPSVRREKDLRILGLSRRTSDEEFFRIRQITIDADEAESREEFVLRLPEHLPSSPMCPRHRKNKSKGKGVCVYHGRNAA